MIHIDFDPDSLEGDLRHWWDDWQDRAEKARDELIVKWETNGTITAADFDNNLWSELKLFLLKHVFHKKCAYCETHIGEARQPGHADHYRPKGRVNYRETPDRECKKYIRAQTEDYNFTPPTVIDHPGYFWLAYNWKNLLPTCHECNSGKGKREQFPIQAIMHQLNSQLKASEVAQLKEEAIPSKKTNDLYYLEPEDLDELEGPKLLHPYFTRAPSDYIEFDQAGSIRPRASEGEMAEMAKYSISAYNLWDENLDGARQKAQEEARTLFETAQTFFRKFRNKLPPADRKEAIKEETIKKIINGETPHSAAQLWYLKFMHLVTD